MFKKSQKKNFSPKCPKIDPESLPGPPNVIWDLFGPCRVDLKHFLKIDFWTVRMRFLLTGSEGTLKNMLFKGESRGSGQAQFPLSEASMVVKQSSLVAWNFHRWDF